MRTRHLSIALAAFLGAWGACLAGAAAGPDGAKPQAASQPAAATRAKQLAECIRIVLNADQPQDVIDAYARGCALDPGNAEIREAYMRRMLRLGRPQVAVYAARALLQLRPDDHLAWAVLGYVHGKRKEWIEAYNATGMALEGLGDDPSVLHNAGQLVAWQEAQSPPPKLSDRARRMIAQKEAHLRKAPQFLKGYKAIAGFYEKRAELSRELDSKIALVKTGIAVLQQQGRAVESAILDLSGQISLHEREIRRLRQMLDDTWRRRYVVDANGNIIREEVDVGSWRLRSDLRDRIDAEKRAIDDLEAKIASQRRAGTALLKDMERRRQEQQKLQKEKDKVREGVDLVFRWDPPAVDGVVTPEAQHPLVFELRKARPKDTGPEAEADRRLRLAKTYLASAMEDKAAAILKDVLANYPNTQAAAEARELYASLLPGGEAPKPK